MQNVFRLRRVFNGLSGHFFAIQNIYVNSNPDYTGNKETLTGNHTYDEYGRDQ